MEIRIIPCIDTIYVKIHPKLLLLTTKSTQENIYIIGKIFNILINSLQESLIPIPTIILIILLCSLKILLLYEEFPQKITP
jgi:hypothetical protein